MNGVTGRPHLRMAVVDFGRFLLLLAVRSSFAAMAATNACSVTFQKFCGDPTACGATNTRSDECAIGSRCGILLGNTCLARCLEVISSSFSFIKRYRAAVTIYSEVRDGNHGRNAAAWYVKKQQSVSNNGARKKVHTFP